MATLALKAFINTQEEEYLRCANYIKELEYTLKHQTNIRTHRTIPKQNRPRPLRIMPTEDLNESFQKQYEDIFFPYLNKVILHNTIALETAKAKQASILRHIESQLCQREDNPGDIREAYHHFLERNQIPTAQISPQLQSKIHTTTTITTERVTPTTTTTTAHSTKDTSTMLLHQPTTTTATPPTTSPNTHKKRKNKLPHPTSKKQPKLDHFLSRKSQSTHPPP